jgi:PhoPQ-activated pathogenicity-related protein
MKGSTMRRLSYLAVAMGLWVTAAWAAPLDNLDRYIAQKDKSYQWRIIDHRTVMPDVEFEEMILTSQTWHDLVWHHRVKIYRPKDCTGVHQAFLLISGGSWNDERERQREENLRRQREGGESGTQPAGRGRGRGRGRGGFSLEGAMFAGQIIRQVKQPVVILENVPLEPIFDGKTEDRIIAYTFDKYMETGGWDWPLLLPMAKSAVRAMDAIQELARKEWKTEVKDFVVGGGSKRGWTTWLTAASDKRVKACAPAVIDVLNMPAQMKHQLEMLGQYSDMIKAYTVLGIQSKMDTPRGKELLRIVDPYSYRERITMPKMIILGTNDPYWTVDSLNLYWDGLVGEKYILYIPNKGHGAIDIPRLTANSVALASLAAGKLAFPKMTWQYETTEKGVRLKVKADKPAQRMWVWLTECPTTNFRTAQWSHEPMEEKDGGYAYERATPEEGYAAMYGEGLFDLGDGKSVYLCTQIRVVGTKPATTAASSAQ